MWRRGKVSEGQNTGWTVPCSRELLRPGLHSGAWRLAFAVTKGRVILRDGLKLL